MKNYLENLLVTYRLTETVVVFGSQYCLRHTLNVLYRILFIILKKSFLFSKNPKYYTKGAPYEKNNIPNNVCYKYLN
jgi:hypothetical protein